MASSGLDQIKFLTNSFSDQRVTGPESYDKAKTQLASDDWEMEVKGLEMIVSISRSRPDVNKKKYFRTLEPGAHQPPFR